MKKKILIFIITYKATFRAFDVYHLIPFKKLKKYSISVLISDDFSNDETVSYIKLLKKKNKKIKINFNKKNLGYGGNIKICLNHALKYNFDYAVMLHGDGQYHPKYIPKMIKKINYKNNNYISAVTGSRMLIKKNAINGKMPFYKFIGNMLLTKLTNILTKSKFTDCHSGFWIYSLKIFEKINLKKITNGFNFDQQIRLQCLKKKLNIEEIPIKTIYGNERSSFHFIYAIRYFFEIIFFKFKN